MAKKSKKTSQTGLALACWILGLLILFIVFLIKQDEIYSNLKTTKFFERLFGKTPTFIENHEVKENNNKEIELGDEEVFVLNTKEEETVIPPKENVETITAEKKESIPNKEISKSDELVNKEKVVEEKTVIENTSYKICFIVFNDDGIVTRKQITRVARKNNSPLVTSINLLINGPTQEERRKGCKTLIPEGTKLLSASIREGVAFLNFNEEFEFNKIGVDGYIAQLMQIVYTATEYSTVNSVQILIDGQKKEYLSEGVWIGSPLSRSSF